MLKNQVQNRSLFVFDGKYGISLHSCRSTAINFCAPCKDLLKLHLHPLSRKYLNLQMFLLEILQKSISEICMSWEKNKYCIVFFLSRIPTYMYVELMNQRLVLNNLS